LLPALGGLDALVFTAGVGENCARVRAEVCRGMAFLGIRLDEQDNESLGGEGDVSAQGSSARILVVKTQEEWQIALECLRLGSRA
jgi:acetate kinase